MSDTLPAVCLKTGDKIEWEGQVYEVTADAKRIGNGPRWLIQHSRGELDLSAAAPVRILSLGPRKRRRGE